MALHDDALQRMAGGQHLLLGLGRSHLGDDGIHRLALESDIVRAPFHIGGGAAEQLGVFLPRIVRTGHVQRHDVEIVFVHALLIERVVHIAHLERDAQLFQVTHPATDDLDAALAAVQIFQHHGLAAGVAQGPVPDRPACIGQQLLRSAQIAAQAVARIGAWRLGHGPQRGGRQAGLERGEQGQLRLGGIAPGLARRVAEQPVHTLIGAVEHLAVHPLVVIGQTQRLAHAHILELLAAQVQKEALKARRQLVLERALDQLARRKAPPRQTPGPVTRAIDAHEIELAGLERLQSRRSILVNLDGDAVEIGQADTHRQRRAPVRRVAHIADVLAELDRTDLVGPAADRRVHHHLVKGLGLAIRAQPPIAAEHRQQGAHGQRQVTIGLFEAKAHRALIDHVTAGHLGKQRLVAGRDIFAQQRLVAVLHILSQYRLAVVKARLLAQFEGRRQAVGRHLHILGQQAIARSRFVEAGGQQSLEQHVCQIGRRRALDREGVVLVEGRIAQIADHAQLAALGRLRVHIVKVLEVGRVPGLTPERIAMCCQGRCGNLAADNQG